MSTEATSSDALLRAWAWMESNRKQLIMGCAGALVVGLIVWYVIYQRNEKATAASEALSAAFLPQFSSRTQDPERYLKVAANHEGSTAAAHAILLAAGGLFADGKYTEALSRFEQFSRDNHNSSLMGEALLGIAACHDALGHTNDAISGYRNLIDHHPTETVIPQAKFALARIYEDQGKPDLALPLFEDVARGNPNGNIGSEAGMRAEEIFIKHPELAPKPATPAAAPAPINLGTGVKSPAGMPTAPKPQVMTPAPGATPAKPAPAPSSAPAKKSP